MRTDLKTDIRTALAGSSAQSPVDTDVLVQGHRRSKIEAALMEMYQAHEVCCCKIIKGIKGKQERVVWWLVAEIGPFKSTWQLNQEKLKKTKSKEAKPEVKRVARRMSPMTSDVLATVTATPGLSLPEVIATKPRADEQKVRNSITSLIASGKVVAQGLRRHHRFYPGAAA